jgi:nucleotide-binding universal stress UspA family protein
MTTKAIVSYDGTPGDEDALVLGRVLADAGAELILTYVRHSTEAEPGHERLQESEAQALLERGAEWLDDPGVERRVVLSGATAEGLRQLAVAEAADIVVFGSDYRTPPGHVAPQNSARQLLEGGTAAVAVAPADYRTIHRSAPRRIGLSAAAGDDGALQTARELAESLGAEVSRDEPLIDLLVIGSRPEAPNGRVLISAAAHRQIEDAACPVLVVPRGVAVRFPVGVA